MGNNQVKEIHPFLQKIIDRLVKTGAGDVVVAEDGHVFFQPSVHIKHLWGAADVKKEGRDAGVHVIIRNVKKRGKRCKYADMPWFQIYVLPIVQKNAQTMTDKERRNMELNKQAMRMAHAVERDPVKAAYYHELHEAHKLNPVGYKKLYPNFFGFVYATIRMELEAQEAEKAAIKGSQQLPKSPKIFLFRRQIKTITNNYRNLNRKKKRRLYCIHVRDRYR